MFERQIVLKRDDIEELFKPVVKEIGENVFVGIYIPTPQVKEGEFGLLWKFHLHIPIGVTINPSLVPKRMKKEGSISPFVEELYDVIRGTFYYQHWMDSAFRKWVWEIQRLVRENFARHFSLRPYLVGVSMDSINKFTSNFQMEETNSQKTEFFFDVIRDFSVLCEWYGDLDTFYRGYLEGYLKMRKIIHNILENSLEKFGSLVDEQNIVGAMNVFLATYYEKLHRPITNIHVMKPSPSFSSHPLCLIYYTDLGNRDTVKHERVFVALPKSVYENFSLEKMDFTTWLFNTMNFLTSPERRHAPYVYSLIKALTEVREISSS